MNRVTFSLIFLLLLINIVQCKKYLVEVEDKKDSNAKKENRDWWRKVKEESDEETIEDKATFESEGKYINKKMRIYFLNQVVK